MNDKNLTDRELILAVDNDPEATPREKELADRLDTALNGTPVVLDKMLGIRHG